MPSAMMNAISSPGWRLMGNSNEMTNFGSGPHNTVTTFKTLINLIGKKYFS